MKLRVSFQRLPSRTRTIEIEHQLTDYYAYAVYMKVFLKSPVHSGEQKNIWICLGTSSAAIFINFLWISLATLPLRFPQWPAAWTFEQGPLIVWPWNVNSRATTSKHSCVRLKEAALARLKNSYHVRLLYTYEVGLQTSTVHVSIVYNIMIDQIFLNLTL